VDDMKQNLTAEKQQLVTAKENYLRLKDEITLWQQEQGSAWADSLQPAESSPYFTLAGLPEELILDLWQRLDASSGESVSKPELLNLWHEFKDGKFVNEYSLLGKLQLSLSGVAQLACKQLQLAELTEDQPFGPCPVCGEGGVIAFLVPPVGKRYLHCVICGHERPVKTTGCVHCGSGETSKQTYLNSEEYPGIEIVACEDCGAYFKQLDLRELTVDDLIWEDIRSLPLNYAAEQWLAERRELQ
jgi:FdhE protein